MYHSLYIGDKNTWDDYNLVPTEKIYFTMPQQKTNVVEIEGASGSLDFSTYASGYPVYSNRTGSIGFYMLDAIDAKLYSNSGSAYPSNLTFYDIFSKIRSELDGVTAKLWLEDDPDWYYEGRINVDCAMGKPRPKVAIGYDVKPYKLRRRPQVYSLNGMGAIINRQVIPDEILGVMPTEFKLTVTGGQATVTFQCPKLSINESKIFQIGTHEPYEWVMYGESTILVSAAVGVNVKMEFIPGRL
ncbi:MAG: hypothetical protein J6U54_13475 [Clostridiales bacterium]|nr:hypothetical protein [Clostridiales bacterium]